MGLSVLQLIAPLNQPRPREWRVQRAKVGVTEVRLNLRLRVLRLKTASGLEECQRVDGLANVVDADNVSTGAGDCERHTECSGCAISFFIADTLGDKAFARVANQDR